MNMGEAFKIGFGLALGVYTCKALYTWAGNCYNITCKIILKKALQDEDFKAFYDEYGPNKKKPKKVKRNTVLMGFQAPQEVKDETL